MTEREQKLVELFFFGGFGDIRDIEDVVGVILELIT